MASPEIKLTPRHWELLGYISEGLNNADIAVRLGITPHSLQIRDAQRRQRATYEEATADAWIRQLAEIRERQWVAR